MFELRQIGRRYGWIDLPLGVSLDWNLGRLSLGVSAQHARQNGGFEIAVFLGPASLSWGTAKFGWWLRAVRNWFIRRGAPTKRREHTKEDLESYFMVGDDE